MPQMISNVGAAAVRFAELARYAALLDDENLWCAVHAVARNLVANKEEGDGGGATVAVRCLLWMHVRPRQPEPTVMRSAPRRFLFGLGALSYMAAPNVPAALVGGFVTPLAMLRANLFEVISADLARIQPDLRALGNALLAFWYANVLPGMGVDAVVVQRTFWSADGVAIPTQGWKGFWERWRRRHTKTGTGPDDDDSVRVPIIDVGTGEIKVALPCGADAYTVHHRKVDYAELHAAWSQHGGPPNHPTDELSAECERALQDFAETRLELPTGCLKNAVGFATGAFRGRYGERRGSRFAIISAREEALNAFEAVRFALRRADPLELRGHAFAGVLEYGAGSTQLVMSGVHGIAEEDEDEEEEAQMFFNTAGSGWLTAAVVEELQRAFTAAEWTAARLLDALRPHLGACTHPLSEAAGSP